MENAIARRAGSILALLAFAVAAAAGVASGAPVGRVVARSLVAMAVFYVLGYVAALIGCRIVAEGESRKPEGEMGELPQKDQAEMGPRVS
jgi:hypothetical protein